MTDFATCTETVPMPLPALSPFTGLSAFPLTPVRDGRLDEDAFAGLIDRLVATGVDSIAPLGSTGCGPFFSPEDRAEVARLTVDRADGIPVTVGIGALSTRDVLTNAEAAAAAGAAALLLAPVSYHPLTETEVVELFRAVTSANGLPVIVYDNPTTTRFTFTTELYARLSEIEGIAAIKIPGLPLSPADWQERVAGIRQATGGRVAIGVSVDAYGAEGLIAGCDAWFSAIGGTIPAPMLAITRAIQAGEAERARELAVHLQPLWDLFAAHGGSLRVGAAIAEHLGLVTSDCLPAPLKGLSTEDKRRVASVVDDLGLS
ncbi:dihydrodipicolinate synthase family protein [Brevibacterium casei]|uniref:dihydrodipicolinate synthase family protein n=2 Tax=Brevibacterium casei TaxID=33889 RepID=UPI000928E3AE|nr:dihydrodipicolinate synthase family protein [Brevibacterium casei]MDH5148240.1 dihydrodipicolinate synthase family protein [Brevibacterium casei]SII47575.1 dihydrodipicolinate synthase DapA_1 [Mycobacteroides abscessus subsp. abscessus]